MLLDIKNSMKLFLEKNQNRPREIINNNKSNRYRIKRNYNTMINQGSNRQAGESKTNLNFFSARPKINNEK